ncbi:TraR/DksA family transcriptional regulator [Pararhodobacter zhoushanensis]|uniref:TraR/DksA C4-type zinc finger protein n=1 Tax=Pararhodobacter zhoushanensis TaxID=2479545 RepID=A0ABT3H183_9RHOB|nr:TraR/DksA C4-type zinc finger protein [Pararhodobacter zhoushanensis]MCW1933547.1 TraR/DksA C4-type zinc finger protein [Pararhodobacter zhoushanensis]
MTQLPADDLPRRKAQLIARLAELDQRLHGIEDELLSHQSRDWEELATERENDEVLTSIGDDGRAELRMIFAALARLDAGSYGVCVTCAAPIAAERLDLLPATPFCRDCAP